MHNTKTHTAPTIDLDSSNMELVVTVKEKHSMKYLNDLNTDQLAQVAAVLPKWVFLYRPYFMMYHHPEWVARFAPTWMSENDTRYMLTHRMEWLVHNKPDIVAKYNLDVLIERNPYWCVKNIPELLAYKAPDLLKEYDQSVLRAFCPEEHVEAKGFFERVSTHLKKYRKYIYFGTKKSHAMIDPPLPKDVLDVLKTTTQP